MQARQLFIEDPQTQRIRFTQHGIDRYGKRFAQIGFDIKTIRTMEHFEKAVDALFEHDMVNLARTEKGKDTHLDNVMSGLPGWD